MIIPSVLAALCSAFQPFEGRVVEPAPFHFEWHGGEIKERNFKNNYLIVLVCSIKTLRTFFNAFTAADVAVSITGGC